MRAIEEDMLATHDCKWEINWDKHTFSGRDAAEIADELEQFAGNEVIHQPIARYSALVDALLVLTVCYAGISAAEFFKKCGGKIGDKLGEEVGNDIVKVYSKLKGLITDKFTKNKSDKGFQCLFQINIDGLLVSAVIHGKSEDAELINTGIDCFEQVFSDTASVLTDFDSDEKVLEVRMVFDSQEGQWRPLFLATNESVYEIGA